MTTYSVGAVSLVYRGECPGWRHALHSRGSQVVTEAIGGRWDHSFLPGDVQSHAFPLYFWKISKHLSIFLKAFSTFLVYLIRIPAVLSHATYILLSPAVYWPPSNPCCSVPSSHHTCCFLCLGCASLCPSNRLCIFH